MARFKKGLSYSQFEASVGHMPETEMESAWHTPQLHCARSQPYGWHHAGAVSL